MHPRNIHHSPFLPDPLLRLDALSFEQAYGSSTSDAITPGDRNTYKRPGDGVVVDNRAEDGCTDNPSVGDGAATDVGVVRGKTIDADGADISSAADNADASWLTTTPRKMTHRMRAA